MTRPRLNVFGNAPWACGLALAFAPAAAPADGPAFPPDQVEFFEAKVRPVLAESCQKCHGATKQASGLRLDSREAALEGGLNGPSVIPGDPDASLLVQAVRWTHADIKMPEKTQLPPPAVEALAAWVKMGAPWAPKAAATAAAAQPSGHWAFRPVAAVTPPAVKDGAWVKTPVDAFILSRLEREGLAPSPPASRRALVRRLTFDLHGLPPTPAEVDAFEKDDAPDAYEKLVDRLLASPRYGERWGRHWLDVARYADTKGYVFTAERKYAYSYTYRDYVVHAFNDDKPYDRFLAEQVAADKLGPGPGASPDSLAALGFLTVGRRFLNDQQEIIDDRIDVVTRGMLGLTVTCARCHDHKYDPIPTEDYYSLHGVFASSVEPDVPPEVPGVVPPELVKGFQAELAARQKVVDDYLAAKRAEVQAEFRAKAPTYWKAAADLKFNPDDPKLDERARADKLPVPRLRAFTRRAKGFLEATKAGHDPVMAPWHALAPLPDAEFAAKSQELINLWRDKPDAAKPINPAVLAALTKSPLASPADLADRYGALLNDLAAAGPDREAVRSAFFADNGPLTLPDSVPLRGRRGEGLLGTDERNKLTELRNAVDALTTTHPGSPPRAMVLNDAPQPVEPHVFLRGNPGRPGPAIPRRFLKVLSPPDRPPFKDGSGRLELARAIASKDNPLTARVFVNRVWMHHFGAGLVTTPSDFGLRSDPPSHPELLDWLAADFMAHGWSVKALHRRIVLSNAYRQASENRPEGLAKDPLNRLVWKANRRRLEFEPLRDALLAVAGRLDLTMGGRSVPINDPPFPPRRTVYGFIDRQNLDGVYRTFDFASPDASTPKRLPTTVPQQALFLMNSPFVVEQARHLAALPEIRDGAEPPRIDQVYRRLFGRPPTADETAAGMEFLKQAVALAATPPTWQYGAGKLVEPSGPVEFRPFAHWTGKAWRPGPNLPDPATAYLNWEPTQGHPGPDADRAAALRWTAPRDADVTVTGLLEHDAKEGDGVRARLVAPSAGLAGTWLAHAGKTETTAGPFHVKAGDALDFVVDCRASDGFDSFRWAPTITETNGPARWSPADDYHGPSSSLSQWEQYAQVLLLTNEFMFVD